MSKLILTHVFILSQSLKMFSGLFLNLLLECINSSEKLILLIQKLSISNFINDIKITDCLMIGDFIRVASR